MRPKQGECGMDSRTAGPTQTTHLNASKETVMNKDRIEGNWKQLKGKAKQRWGKLTDDDLDVVDGKRQELEGKLQEAYGYSRDKAKQEVDDFSASC